MCYFMCVDYNECFLFNNWYLLTFKLFLIKSAYCIYGGIISSPAINPEITVILPFFSFLPSLTNRR